MELVKNSGLSKFLISFEFIGVLCAQQILTNKIRRRFTLNEEANYEIDLGYHTELRETLEKFGISELHSYVPQGDVGGRTQYYVYDKPNYFKFMLAIVEISDENCLEERLHTLKYYCNNEKWDELKGQLNFFMEFKSRTGVNIDYMELLFKLFDYAKENEIHGSFSILHTALVNLAENADNKKTREKAHNFLFETTLWEMTQLDKEGGTSEEKQELKTKLFEHSLKAGLFGEAAKYLMVASGFKGTEEPICSDLANSVHVSLLECGQKIYVQSEQLAVKDEKIAALEKQLAKRKLSRINKQVQFLEVLHFFRHD